MSWKFPFFLFTMFDCDVGDQVESAVFPTLLSEKQKSEADNAGDGNDGEGEKAQTKCKEAETSSQALIC